MIKMTETVLLEKAAQTATLTLNRPTFGNGFNLEMANALEAHTDELKHDASIRVVVLQGAGAQFMVGGDIHFFKEKLDTMPQGVMKIVRTLNASIVNLRTMGKPVVASVHGAVAGVGVSLMLAADLVIAEAKTKLTMAYSGIGISPDGGASYHLPRAIGMKNAMAALLLSETMTAMDAKTLGLINWVLPQEELSSFRSQLLERLADGPTQSYAAIKQLMFTSMQSSLAEQLELEGMWFERLSQTKDFKEGVHAFLEKRSPHFIGG